jgi:glycosyltransferase involved in cell wall biosynthesis
VRHGGCVAVVPAHGAEATIARTLRSIFEQDGATVADVVVVASPSDRTADVAEQLGATVLRTPNRLSAGAARNLGRQSASYASMILFVDADCALERRALRALMTALEEEELDAVGASIESEPSSGVAWVRHALEFKDAEPGARSTVTPLIPSATLLCRAAAFDAAGGFPDLWPGEDLVFAARLERTGHRVARIANAITVHRHPPGFAAMVRHQFALGLTSARARRMEPMAGSRWAYRPWAVPLLFMGRFGRMIGWAARTSQLGKAASPRHLGAYLTGLTAWCMGFGRGAGKAEP